MYWRRGSKQKTRGTVRSRSREDSLDCIPVRNPQIKERENESGELCLAYQVRVRPWFQNIVRKITGRTDDVIERKLQLDGLGSSAWRTIDGEKNVKEIIDEFRKMHQLNPREAEISVTTFLKELGRRGLIALREEKKPTGRPEAS